jgi:hypothetical protein
MYSVVHEITLPDVSRGERIPVIFCSGSLGSIEDVGFGVETVEGFDVLFAIALGDGAPSTVSKLAYFG